MKISHFLIQNRKKHSKIGMLNVIIVCYIACGARNIILYFKPSKYVLPRKNPPLDEVITLNSIDAVTFNEFAGHKIVARGT